ncbi:MAG TPA: serine protease [Aliicoccus persicus]|uniref:Serine protease n=1 Tax=Aliicoccus persicus TaxID=930138 RepID=A0A921B6K1_9STAP|nr:serine protease [Aliicoccus persicus]
MIVELANYNFMTIHFIDSFSGIITNPVISFILLLVFFVGLLLQVFSSRINVYGILSIIAILLFYSGHFIVSDNSMISLILFILAAVLIVIEIFVIGTLLGLIGLLLLIISIVTVSNNVTLYSIFLLIIFIISIITLVILMKKNKNRKIPILSRLILTDNTDAESGYSSFDDRSHLVGEEAVTLTPLRPSGIIKYNDKRIDAVAEGSFIPSDVRVRVIFVEGTRIVVREIKD